MVKNSKISIINIHYPRSEDLNEELYRKYNNSLAKVILNTLSLNEINKLMIELEQKKGKNK